MENCLLLHFWYKCILLEHTSFSTESIADGDENEEFALEKENNAISVAKPLDRETTAAYMLTVIATNECNQMPSEPVDDRAKLYVNITVTDQNDCPPVFDKDLIYEGISIDETGNWERLVGVSDEDEAEQFTFEITGDIVASPDNVGLTDIAANAFEVETRGDATKDPFGRSRCFSIS